MLDNTPNNKKKLSCDPSHHAARGCVTSAGTAAPNQDPTRAVSPKQIGITGFGLCCCDLLLFLPPSSEEELKKTRPKTPKSKKTSKCPQRGGHGESAPRLLYCGLTAVEINPTRGSLAALQSRGISYCWVPSKLTIDALCDHLKCCFVCEETTALSQARRMDSNLDISI